MRLAAAAIVGVLTLCAAANGAECHKAPLLDATYDFAEPGVDSASRHKRPNTQFLIGRVLEIKEPAAHVEERAVVTIEVLSDYRKQKLIDAGGKFLARAYTKQIHGNGCAPSLEIGQIGLFGLFEADGYLQLASGDLAF